MYELAVWVAGEHLGGRKGYVMRAISSAGEWTRCECEACGTEQVLRRFVSYQMFGLPRYVPYEGQWVQCQACQDWNPLVSAAEPALMAG